MSRIKNVTVARRLAGPPARRPAGRRGSLRALASSNLEPAGAGCETGVTGAASSDVSRRAEKSIVAAGDTDERSKSISASPLRTGVAAAATAAMLYHTSYKRNLPRKMHTSSGSRTRPCDTPPAAWLRGTGCRRSFAWRRPGGWGQGRRSRLRSAQVRAYDDRAQC